MILTLLSIAGILNFTLQLEDQFGIPSPLGLISLLFIFHSFFHAAPLFTNNHAEYSLLVLFFVAGSIDIRFSRAKR